MKKDYKKKKYHKIYQNLSKEETKATIWLWMFQKSFKRKKSLLRIEKTIIEWEKWFTIKINDLKSSFEAIDLIQKAYLNKKIWKYTWK